MFETILIFYIKEFIYNLTVHCFVAKYISLYFMYFTFYFYIFIYFVYFCYKSISTFTCAFHCVKYMFGNWIFPIFFIPVRIMNFSNFNFYRFRKQYCFPQTLQIFRLTASVNFESNKLHDSGIAAISIKGTRFSATFVKLYTSKDICLC